MHVYTLVGECALNLGIFGVDVYVCRLLCMRVYMCRCGCGCGYFKYVYIGVYMYVYVCRLVYIYVCICALVAVCVLNIYIFFFLTFEVDGYVCMRVCIHVHAGIYTFVAMYALSMCTLGYMCICTGLCVYMCVHIVVCVL